MCVHFFQLWRFENYTSNFRPHLRYKSSCSFSPSPSTHVLLWWWACSWLIFSLKWHLQSSFFLLHPAAIKLQEANDSIDEEDPRPTSSRWSYIITSLAFSFKFHKMWIDNPDCRRPISKVLSSHIYGCHMYVLGQKLRGLKNELKP